jgi:hypothetical protein
VYVDGQRRLLALRLQLYSKVPFMPSSKLVANRVARWCSVMVNGLLKRHPGDL